MRILGRLFRGKLLRRLEQALERKELPGEEHANADLRAAARKDWVVYSKPPFAGPEQVLRYLGRYTHRVAISNHRLVALDDRRVTFRWNDRARGNPHRLMTLDVAEFLRRFLLHLLPPGLMRIRHYGLLANPTRQRDLARCRECIATDPLDDDLRQTRSATTPLDPTACDGLRCPRCRIGHLVVLDVLPPRRARPP